MFTTIWFCFYISRIIICLGYKYTVTFIDWWLLDNPFKDWYQKVEDVHSARCSCCCEIFNIGSMGSSDSSHMNGKKHCEWAPPYSNSEIIL